MCTSHVLLLRPATSRPSPAARAPRFPVVPRAAHLSICIDRVAQRGLVRSERAYVAADIDPLRVDRVIATLVRAHLLLAAPREIRLEEAKPALKVGPARRYQLVEAACRILIELGIKRRDPLDVSAAERLVRARVCHAHHSLPVGVFRRIVD
eukprot:6033953-Prymnesium_polylepis.2